MTGLNFEVKPSGLIKNPTIVMLPDGPDHKNWIEVGEKEECGLKVVVVAYAPSFGWLWRSGWVTEEELEKAKEDGEFYWLFAGIGGHRCI